MPADTLPTADVRAMLEKAPTLVLRKRTPAEVRAWHEGARLALSWLLGRLPGVVRHPADATVPAADVMAAARFVTEAIQTSEEVIAAAGDEYVEKARQHIYDLAAGRARFSMSIPPRAAEDSDFVLLAACEAAEARKEERDALARELIAAREERDRVLRDFTGLDAAEWDKEGKVHAEWMRAENRGGGVVTCPDCGKGWMVDGTADVDLSPRRCEACEHKAVVVERDRLRLTIACERGEAAPEGWMWTPHDTWSHYATLGLPGPSASVWRHSDQNGVEWSWRVNKALRGECKTALEAIEAANKAEAADRAAKEG